MKDNDSKVPIWIKKPRCMRCGKVSDDCNLWCDECGSLRMVPAIKGPGLDAINIDFSGKNGNYSPLWSFKEFLPGLSPNVSFHEGGTPILQIHNFKGAHGLYIKLEARNPTGTFRDRGSALIVSHALMEKKGKILSISTGSYAISLAAYCAWAGIHSINVLPQNTELSKIEQLRLYGSELIEFGETLEQARARGIELLSDKEIYRPLPRENILTIEGQKTIGLEIIYRMMRVKKRAPEFVFVPMGSGSLFLSVYRGFMDAKQSGWIDKIPKIVAVSLNRKSSNADMVESLEINSHDEKLMDSCMEIIRKNDFIHITVEPENIIKDAMELARTEGILIEPASASVLTAFKILNESEPERFKPDECLAVLTGSGLNALNIFASKLRTVKKAVWGLRSASTRKFEILNLIAENKATNGSEIWKALGKKNTPQSIYQHLAELEEKGLIVGKMETKKSKRYRLTRKGMEALDKLRDLIDLL